MLPGVQLVSDAMFITYYYTVEPLFQDNLMNVRFCGVPTGDLYIQRY